MRTNVSGRVAEAVNVYLTPLASQVIMRNASRSCKIGYIITLIVTCSAFCRFVVWSVNHGVVGSYSAEEVGIGISNSYRAEQGLDLLFFSPFQDNQS